MTQEEKQLLLQDLCARLPYGVKGIITYDESNIIFTVEGIDKNVLHLSDAEECHIEDIKPYLRPMSSMTEEEKTELFQLMGNGTDIQRIDFYLSHHFDYRGLIEKGLALEAKEGMYK